jgi:hypothetical protein
VSLFPTEWLKENYAPDRTAAIRYAKRAEDTRQPFLWNRSTFEASMPEAPTFDEVMQTDQGVLQWLETIASLFTLA